MNPSKKEVIDSLLTLEVLIDQTFDYYQKLRRFERSMLWHNHDNTFSNYTFKELQKIYNSFLQNHIDSIEYLHEKVKDLKMEYLK